MSSDSIPQDPVSPSKEDWMLLFEAATSGLMQNRPESDYFKLLDASLCRCWDALGAEGKLGEGPE